MPSSRNKLFVRLYTDEDITPRLAKALRDREFDAVSAYEVGNIEVSDSVHLDFAAAQGRAILSRTQIAPAGFACLAADRQSSGQAADYKSAASKNVIY